MQQELNVEGSSLVEEIRNELLEIHSMAINDQVERFEALHSTLVKALSSIDGL